MARITKLPEIFSKTAKEEYPYLDKLFSIDIVLLPKNIRNKSLIIPSPFGRKAMSGPKLTGAIQDSKQRRMCFRDGKHAPCDEFGGEGESWNEQRTNEDLYDAARRLINKIKAGDASGGDELLGMLATTPAEQLKKLKSDHKLYAEPEVKKTLTELIQKKLTELGYAIEQGQQEQQMKTLAGKVGFKDETQPTPTQPPPQAPKQPQQGVQATPTGKPATPVKPVIEPSKFGNTQQGSAETPSEQPTALKEKPNKNKTKKPELSADKVKEIKDSIVSTLENHIENKLGIAAPDNWRTYEDYLKEVSDYYLENARKAGLDEDQLDYIKMAIYHNTIEAWDNSSSKRTSELEQKKTKEKETKEIEALKYRKSAISEDKPINERIKDYTLSVGDDIRKTLPTIGEEAQKKVEEAYVKMNEAERIFNAVDIDMDDESDLLLLDKMSADYEEVMEKCTKIYKEAEDTIIKALKEKLKCNSVWEYSTSDQETYEKHRETSNEGCSFISGLFAFGSDGGEFINTISVSSIPHDEEQRDYHIASMGMFLSERTNVRTFIHEYGHYLEDSVPGVHEAVLDFLQHRIKDGKVSKLKELYPDRNYKDYEYGVEDDFRKTFGDNAHYVGKIYPGAYATEILSMGLEQLYTDPLLFAKNDPEYFDFICGICDGSLRKYR